MNSAWSERVGDAADVGRNPQKSQRQTRLPDAPDEKDDFRLGLTEQWTGITNVDDPEFGRVAVEHVTGTSFYLMHRFTLAHTRTDLCPDECYKDFVEQNIEEGALEP
jgi:hypothetical protein